MNAHFYMTVFPEALVASMLSPEEFAPYFAVGSRKRLPGRAIFFEVDPKLSVPYFDMSRAEDIQPHPDGIPKHSITISIYRVLEHIPLDMLGRLFLVTRDGKYLDIQPRSYPAESVKSFRLYQELCPMHPSILSKLQPTEFAKSVTDPEGCLQVPKILFVDLLLGQIADPNSDVPARALPYADMGLIRDVLSILKTSNRETLVVDRAHSRDFFYRTVGEGLFLADRERVVFYPFPEAEQRESGPIHEWWRSAELS